MHANGFAAADIEAITAARGEEFAAKLVPAAHTAQVDHGLDVRYGGVSKDGVRALLLDRTGAPLAPDQPGWQRWVETCAPFGLVPRPDGLVELAKPAPAKSAAAE